MAKALGEARARNSASFAPRIEMMQIPVDKIRDVIGSGGKVIREIVEKTGAKISVEDDGSVKIASPDGARRSRRRATGSIPSSPSRKSARSTRARSSRSWISGAFVNFFGAKDGLVHISQLTSKMRPEKVTDVVKEGEEVFVKLLGFDERRQGAAVDEGRRPGDRPGDPAREDKPKKDDAAGVSQLPTVV